MNPVPVTFSWDPAPEGSDWFTVRIYEKTEDAKYKKVVEVAADQTKADVEIEPGPHTFIARSYNGTWESSDSNPVITPSVPIVPPNLKVSIVLTFSSQ